MPCHLSPNSDPHAVKIFDSVSSGLRFEADHHAAFVGILLFSTEKGFPFINRQFSVLNASFVVVKIKTVLKEESDFRRFDFVVLVSDK